MKLVILGTMIAVLLLLVIPSLIPNSGFCTSAYASMYGGWKSEITAPHDGTVVELLQTYGLSPWTGLHKWKHGRWVSHDKPGFGMAGLECVYWRPVPQQNSSKVADQ